MKYDPDYFPELKEMSAAEMMKVIVENKRLVSLNERMREALEWYADYRNYTKQEGLIENTSIVTSHVQLDQGIKAIKALEE